MQVRVAVAIALLLVAAIQSAAATPISGDCAAFAEHGVTILGARGLFVEPTVVMDNNTSGGPVNAEPTVVFDNNLSARPLPAVLICIGPSIEPPRSIPEPPPPLAFTGGYAFWTGPNVVDVSWRTNIFSTGRVAWGVEPGRFAGFIDVTTPDGLHDVRITGAPRDQPLHITVQAVSAAGEILQLEIRGPSPQLAPAAPSPAAPNVSLAILSSLAAAAAVLAVRTATARRK